jgi:phage baseplate assembly protein gpV
MRKTIVRVLAAFLTFALFYCPTDSKAGGPPDLNGTWIGYYNDGTKSEYVWAIHQTNLTLSIENVGGKTAKSKGRIDGDKVIAQDFATQNGTLSDDGMKITWADGVVWKKLPTPNLSGTWIGYYNDGTKSEYVWAIHQTGSTLSIENVGGTTAKSKGRIDGDKVIAQDFATQNGKLSADGKKITWTDGVVWKKQ